MSSKREETELLDSLPSTSKTFHDSSGVTVIARNHINFTAIKTSTNESRFTSGYDVWQTRSRGFVLKAHSHGWLLINTMWRYVFVLNNRLSVFFRHTNEKKKSKTLTGFLTQNLSNRRSSRGWIHGKPMLNY